MEPGSPDSFKSQLGEDLRSDNLENCDPSSSQLSYSGLQTQIISRGGQRPESSASSNPASGRNVLSPTDNIINVLGDASTSKALKSISHNLQGLKAHDSTEPDAAASDLAQGVTGARSDPCAKRGEELNESKDSEETLECVRLEQPSSPLRSDEDVDMVQDVVTKSQPVKYHQDVHVSARVLPFSLLDRIREIRRGPASAASRLTPFWARKIDETQKKILESEESWQPALIGKPTREGTIPLKLYTKLGSSADGKAQAGRVLSKQPAMLHDIQEDQIAVGRRDQEACLDAAKPRGTVESSQAPSVEWSSSSVRSSPVPLLPPDSSPVRKSTTDEPLNNFPTPVPSSPRPVQKADLSTESTNQKHSSGYVTERPVPIPQPTSDPAGSSDKPSSTLCQESGGQKPPPLETDIPATCIPEKRLTVNVKQTPYKSTSTPPTPDSQQSDCTTFLPRLTSHIPSSSVVCGTYRRSETPVVHQQSSTNRVLGSSKTRTEQQEGVCANSQPSQSDSRSGGAGFARGLSHKPEVGPQIDTVEDANITENHNAGVDCNDFGSTRYLGSLELGSDRPTKRVRLSTPAGHEGGSRARDLSYASLDDSRRQARREFHRSLARKPKTTRDFSTMTDAGRFEEVDPYSRRMVPSPRLATDEDHTIQSNDRLDHRAHNGGPKGNVSLESELDDVRSLFAAFKATYAPYKGSNKNFVAALKLLQDLKSQGKAPHPSLWDDFIFSHFHNYRGYLHQVIEDGGSAIPYAEFYNERIEHPHHMQRVVKLSHLSGDHARSSITPAFDASVSTSDALVRVGPSRTSTSARRPVAPETPIAITSSSPPATVPSQKNEDVFKQPQPPLDNNSATRLASSRLGQESLSGRESWLDRSAGDESPELAGTPMTQNVPPSNPSTPSTVRLTRKEPEQQALTNIDWRRSERPGSGDTRGMATSSQRWDRPEFQGTSQRFRRRQSRKRGAFHQFVQNYFHLPIEQQTGMSTYEADIFAW